MIGRNDLCPCGSGRKYKKCCLNKDSVMKIKPLNQPESIDYHCVRVGNEWVKRPGCLAVRIHTTDTKDIGVEIESIFKNIFNHFEEVKFQEFRDRLHNCKHKLYAVRHYKLSVGKEIKLRIEEFNNGYQANSGVEIEKDNHKLIYETESFLFQVKSSLDLLIQALGYAFPGIKSFRTFAHSGVGEDFISGGKVIKKLREENIEIADLFEQNRKLWIQDLVSMRDTITHYRRLKDFHCFVEEPYKGKEKVIIHYPTMPGGKLVDDYCKEIYEDLLNLYKDVFDFIIKIGVQVGEQ